MTELSLIFGLVVGALLFTAGLLRWLLSLESGGAESRRLFAAVQRASAAISWRQAKRGSALTAGLLVLIVALGPLRESDDAHATWLMLGLSVGTLVSVALAQLVLVMVTRAATRAASAMRGPVGHSVTIGLRGGAAVALVAEVSSIVLGSVVLLPLWSAEDDFAATRQLMLGGLLIGALIPALVNQISSGAVYYSGQLGRRDPAFKTSAQSYQLDARNPTMVLDVVGAHLGHSVVRAQTSFCSSLFLHLASLMAVLQLGPEEAPGLVALPLVVRAVSLAGTGFAVLATRVDDAEDVTSSLYRGQLSAALLGLASVWGANYWFLGEAHFLPLSVVGSVALLGAMVTGFATRISLVRGSSALRELRESSKLGASLSLPGTLASAFLRSVGPLAGMLVASSVGLYLAASSGASIGLSLSLVLASFAAATPYAATLSSFEPLIHSAGGLLSMDEKHQRPDLKSKVSGMHNAAQAAGAIGQSQLLSATALAGLAVAWLLSPNVGPETLPKPPILLTFIGSLCGAGLVLAYCGAGLRHVGRTAGTLKLELQRQLQGFARDAEGHLQLPKDFRPRYRDHLEQVGSGAVNRSEQLVALAILVPVTLSLVLMLALDGASGRSAAAIVLMAFVAFATLTGLCISLLSAGTASTWGCAVRDARSDGAAGARARAVVESGVCLAEVTAPMAQLMIICPASLSAALLVMLF